MVKGYSRSLVCDLTRNTYAFIPNVLYDILSEHHDKTISAIKSEYEAEYSKFIDEYFSFLENHEYIIYCDKDEQDLFPKLILNFETPSIIDNSIIDIDSESNHDFSKIFTELKKVYCRNVQLRIFDKISLSELKSILDATVDKDLEHFHIIIQFSNSISYNDLIILMDKYGVYKFDIHNTPIDLIANLNHQIPVNRRVAYTKQFISSEDHCGVVSERYFAIDIRMFAESQSFNTCLNKKISVDKRGFVKNCPSMIQNYGSHHNVNITDVVAQDEFKSIWNINKEQIDVCKDCEFRHICVDCRAYLKNTTDKYSKPKKCNYDPYNNTWSV